MPFDDNAGKKNNTRACLKSQQMWEKCYGTGHSAGVGLSRNNCGCGSVSSLSRNGRLELPITLVYFYICVYYIA